MILKAVREMRIYEKEKKYYYCGCLCACSVQELRRVFMG